MRSGHAEMTVKRASQNAKSGEVFGRQRKQPKMVRVGLYARVSTQDQQTIPLQMRAMREYAANRGWSILLQVKEVGSGASERELRRKLMDAARRREIDVVLVWRLDRWGRSLADLVSTLEELNHLGVGFVSLTEALDLTTPTGRAMAGLLSVFAAFEHEILRERVRAGLEHARQNGQRLGRPATAAVKSVQIRKLHRAGVSKAEIARRLSIGRTSVRRILTATSSVAAASNTRGKASEKTMLPTLEPNINPQLWKAIDETRLIRLIYKNRERIVEPHDYGIHNGTAKLLGYQVAGSSSHKLPDWRWMEEDLISDIHILNRTFPGGRPTPSGKHHKWDKLFIRVKPADKGRK
jgi:putative DNA-invertase from lambdoid prophage Rac